MEFLVEFEVNIPKGTAEYEINDRETAEASAAAKLVDDGHLARVWKLPAAPGETRIAGLYRADSTAELDGLLAGLPLFDWMNVTVTRLDRHPSDPASFVGSSDPGVSAGPTDGPARPEGAVRVEYLVTMTTHVPAGTSQDAVEEIRGREAARSRELAARGNLLRLWRPPLQPGEWRTLGLFAAADIVELHGVLASMPLHVWRTDEVTALSPHPNDPALVRR